MRKSRFVEKQIVAVLKESEAGTPTPERIRQHGISRNAFYNWRRKYGGPEVNEARRLKHLEAENRSLKQIVAAQILVNCALKGEYPYSRLRFAPSPGTQPAELSRLLARYYTGIDQTLMRTGALSEVMPMPRLRARLDGERRRGLRRQFSRHRGLCRQFG